MSQEHTVEKMQQRIKEAIIAAYPEDIFPTPLDVSHLKDNNAAYIMREMAGAVASIAKDTIEETLTSLHHSHTEEVEAYRLGISKIASELREAGFTKTANQIDHDLKILAKNPTIETLNTPNTHST